MSSLALSQFSKSLDGARILINFEGLGSTVTTDQALIDQTALKASVALAVGCWEGYIEDVLREFLAKVRTQSHRKQWSLIAQFESMVDKRMSSFNTPNWEQTRNVLIETLDLDPISSWTWTAKFANSIDTKNFFDGVLGVRHAFAHGFRVPLGTFGLINPGVIDRKYAQDAIDCIEFFAKATDDLLEHDLKHKHSCQLGWL